jgi:hypothetical protein
MNDRRLRPRDEHGDRRRRDAGVDALRAVAGVFIQCSARMNSDDATI